MATKKATRKKAAVRASAERKISGELTDEYLEQRIPPDWRRHDEFSVKTASRPWTVKQSTLERLADHGLDGEGYCGINLDTGFRPHRSLPTPVAVRNFTSGRADDVMDNHGHGTHTIGSMVGRDGLSYAPKADIAVGQVLGDNGGGSNTDAGLRWAADVTDVIRKKGLRPGVLSCSWGAGGAVSSSTTAGLRACEEAGLWVLGAAGNAGWRTGRDMVISPARSPHMVAVGSHEEDFDPSTFTSGGPAVAISAGGSYIISCGLRNNLELQSGTSMACPTAASIMTLLRQTMEMLGMVIPATTQDLLAWMNTEEFLVDAGRVGRDPIFGNGIITMENVLHWIESKMLQMA